MFTFKYNKLFIPIVKIVDSKRANKIIYLDETKMNTSASAEEAKIKPIKGNTYCEYCDKYFCDPSNLTRHKTYSCPKKTLNELVQNEVKKILMKTLDSDSGSSSSSDEDLNKYIKKTIKDPYFNEITLENGKFQQLPNPFKRDILYIAGATDSGKSHYIGEYLTQFKKIFPKKEIYLFSRIDDDVSFDHIKGIKRIKIGQNLVDYPIDCKKDLLNSLCIFDDIDSIQDAKVSNAVERLQNDILLCGRDQLNQGNDIYIISSSHQVTDYKKTRNLLNEATSLIVFPQSSGVYGITRALKYYMGLDKKQIDKIVKEPSRWISIHHRAPMYVITENKLYKLN